MLRRWTTHKQIGELFKRAKCLLDYRGVDRGDDRFVSEFRTTLYYVILSRDDLLHVHDQVAMVATFDYQTGAVSSIYGSTAMNVLLNMRKTMVLEDVAGCGSEYTT